MRRRGAALAVAALLLAACGGEERRSGPPPIVTEQVGRGAQTAWVIRQDVDRPQPVVIFLHGWGATLPRVYRPWLDHLARRGNAVIYPRYQDSFLTPPAQALGNALAGIRLALRAFEPQPGSLVVTGHSAGGSLSADYAATATAAGLPAPRAIFAMYPGRALDDGGPRIPEIDPALIPADTEVVALAGSRDVVVGSRVARRIVSGATRVPRSRRRFVLVRDRALSDHLGPQRATPAARAYFWRRLDALIERARR